MEEGEEVITEQSQTGKWYTPLTRVTTLSKYLAMALFVMLPFVGFWLGVEYGAKQLTPSQEIVTYEECREAGGAINNLTNDCWIHGNVHRTPYSQDLTTPLNTPIIKESIETESITVNEVDLLLQRISNQHEFHFTEPEDQVFEWRWYEGGNHVATPTISAINGRAIQGMDLSFQDNDDEYGSYVYRLDAEIAEYFESREFFEQSTVNAVDYPTNGSSLLGYENTTTGIVCLRTLEDTGSEFLIYRIACGKLTSTTEDVQGPTAIHISI